MDILNNFSVLGKSTFKDEVKVQKGAVFSGSEVSFTSGVSFKDNVTFTNAPTFPDTVEVANLTVSDTLTSSKTLAAAGATFGGEVVFNEATRFTCSTKPASFTSPINACSVTACTIKADSAEIPSIAFKGVNENFEGGIALVQELEGEQTEWLLDIHTKNSMNLTATGPMRLISCSGAIEFFENKAVEFEKTGAKFSVPFTGSEITGTTINACALNVTSASSFNTLSASGAAQFNNDVAIEGKAVIKGGLDLQKKTDGTEYLNSQIAIKAPSLTLGGTSVFEVDSNSKALKISSAGDVFIGSDKELVYNSSSGELCTNILSATEFHVTNGTIENITFSGEFSKKSDESTATIFKLIDESCSANVTTVIAELSTAGSSTETVAFKSYVDAELCAAKESFKAPDGTSPAKYESATNPVLAADEFAFDVVLKNTYSATPVMQIVDKNGTVKYADLKYNGARGDGKQTITVGLLHEGTVAKDEYKLIVFGI